MADILGYVFGAWLVWFLLGGGAHQWANNGKHPLPDHLRSLMSGGAVPPPDPAEPPPPERDPG